MYRETALSTGGPAVTIAAGGFCASESACDVSHPGTSKTPKRETIKPQKSDRIEHGKDGVRGAKIPRTRFNSSGNAATGTVWTFESPTDLNSLRRGEVPPYTL
jgi:hypothetical protein